MTQLIAATGDTDIMGVPPRLRAGDWQGYWQDLLAGLSTKRVLLTDFDQTVWEDVLHKLNLAFSPLDPDTGDQRWKLYHQAFRGGGATINGVLEILNAGQHCQRAYRDLLEQTSLSRLVSYAQQNVPLIGGFKQFTESLQPLGVQLVGISHGIWQPAMALLDHHRLRIPFIANWVENGAVMLADESEGGLDKARLAQLTVELGYELVACAGDSAGDIGMATVTRNAGGLIIACGDLELAAWCRRNVQSDQWILVETYDRFCAGTDLTAADIINRRLYGRRRH